MSTTINGLNVPSLSLPKFNKASRKEMFDAAPITDPTTVIEKADHCYKWLQHSSAKPVYIYDSLTRKPTLYEQRNYDGQEPKIEAYVLTSKLLYRICRQIVNKLAPAPDYEAIADETSDQLLIEDDDLELLEIEDLDPF